MAFNGSGQSREGEAAVRGPGAAGMEGAGSQEGRPVSSIVSHPQGRCRGNRLRQESKSRFSWGKEATSSLQEQGKVTYILGPAPLGLTPGFPGGKVIDF